MPKTTIMVSHRQIGFHWWPGAPEEVAYLAHPHRHLFLMVASFEVQHSDRQLEFHTVQTAIREQFKDVHDFGPRSCEDIARELGDALASMGMPPEWVEVYEDEEHGARVEWGELQ